MTHKQRMMAWEREYMVTIVKEGEKGMTKRTESDCLGKRIYGDSCKEEKGLTQKTYKQWKEKCGTKNKEQDFRYRVTQ